MSSDTTTLDAPSPKPWLIGESNPYQAPGADPEHRFDLYPLPPNASGGRLCRLVLGMEQTTYLRAFVRRDLLEGKWSVPKARVAASALWRESGAAPLVLLGAKVCEAFGLPYQPFTAVSRAAMELLPHRGLRTIVVIPHPSGLNRAWHEPGAYQRARNLVLPLLAAKETAGTPM